MKPTFILEIYNNTFYKEQGTYYSLSLTRSKWWELYEVEGLDPSFTSLEVSSTSDKTGVVNTNISYDNRNISFSLKLDPCNIDNALKLFSRYLINGTYCVIRIKENSKLFMPCYISNYTFNRWQANVTADINVEALDRFWHLEEVIAPLNKDESFNIVTDAPCKPFIMLSDVDLTEYANYFINRIIVSVESYDLKPNLYNKGVTTKTKNENLDFYIYANKISTNNKFLFYIDCEQQQTFIAGENITQQVNTNVVDLFQYSLNSGAHKISITFDLVTEGQTTHISVTPAKNLIIQTRPLFITYPNNLTDDIDGLVLSENLIPENIKIGVNILGIEGTYGGGGFDLYKGITEVTPALSKKILQTQNTIIEKNITVNAISPVYEDGAQVVDTVTDKATTAKATKNKAITDKSSKVYIRPSITSEGWYKAQEGDTQTEIQIDEAEQAKIVAENIKKGVTILGVEGTLESGGSSTSNLELINKAPASGDIRQYIKKLDFSNIDTSDLNYCLSLFESCTNLESIIFPTSFNLQNVVSFENMFSNCSSLVSLDLSNFDTTNVTTMKKMFFACSKLKNIILSNWATNKVTDMSQMFDNCSSLVSLDLSNFDTTNLENATSMFANCISLTSLDLSSFETTKLTNIQTMFSNCSKLTSLNLSSFDTSNVENMTGAFNCPSLVEFIPPATFAQNNLIETLDFVACPLSHSSAVALINSLATRTNEPILTLSLETSETLTAEETAIATNKGWTIL